MLFISKISDYIPDPGCFTAIPSSMIDRAYLEHPRGFFQKFWHFLKIRLFYFSLFIPLACLDLLISGVLAIRFALGTFFTSDSFQELRLQQQKKYATLFSKNFYALFFSFLGFISPKLIAFYFIKEQLKKEGVMAGGRYYHDKKAVLVKPRTESELRDVILQAKSKGYKLMPVGAGFSQGKQFLPEGGNGAVVVDLSEFNFIEINGDEKTATVGAGACWAEIQNRANESKLALLVMQASNVFSVAGSISTKIHGWNHITGTVADTVLSMEIMNAQGEKQVLTPDDKLFHQITGGFGLFGIITKVKIKLTDNILLEKKGVNIPTDKYVAHFRNVVQKSEKTKMHLYRLSLDPDNLLDGGISVDFDTKKDATPVKTEHLTQESNEGSRFNRVAINFGRRFSKLRKGYWDYESKHLIANTSPMLSTNAIMQPPIKAMFHSSISEAEWLQEYFLPEEELSGFIKELGALLMQNKVCLLNASVRFVKKDDRSLLSYTRGGDRFAVVLCFNQSLRDDEVIKAKKWLRKSQHLAVQKGGTYYLPYQHISDPEDFSKAYPGAKEAQQYKKEVDPDCLFTSGLYKKYMADSPKKKNWFRKILSNTETKKMFSIILSRKIKEIKMPEFYALLEDIMEYNDSHEEIYQELCRRISEIMPGTWISSKRILSSLSSSIEEFREQASVQKIAIKKNDDLEPDQLNNGILFKQKMGLSGDECSYLSMGI